MIFDQIDVQAAMGLGSAFVTSGDVHSPLSESSIWLSQCYPGLSGIVRLKGRDVAVVFVDEIVPVSALIVSVLPPKSLNPDNPGKWTVNVQSQMYGWQFSCLRDERPLLGEAPLVIFIKWIPNALGKALQAHDDLYIAKKYADDELLVGSDYEKESLSRYHLATGLSSIAHALAGNGILKMLSQTPGAAKALSLPFAEVGIAHPALEV